MGNKYEELGREKRRRGEPKPPKKTKGFLTTEDEVRNREDERIGWECENQKRKEQAK